MIPAPSRSPDLTSDTTDSALGSLDLATLRLESVADGIAEFTVPGTQYRLDLAVDAGLEDRTGRRIRGRVRGRALRMHRASAGGNFIEPLQGHPRIVQGVVLAIDPAANEVVLDLVVPVRISMHEDQDAGSFSTGDVVNFYMESGTRFEAETVG